MPVFRDTKARRRNGASQENLLRRSSNDMDDSIQTEKSSLKKNAFRLTLDGNTEAYVRKIRSPHTTEDLIAHEANFDASGAHLGFYYPESQDEDEEGSAVIGRTKKDGIIITKSEVFITF